MTVLRTLAVTAATLACVLVSYGAFAQTAQPYAGLETRAIRTLSEAQIADLRAGRGMGFALAAELNGYPGPVHVLESDRSLDLSDAQRAEVQALFAAMKAEAIPLGERLIEQERALNAQFAGGTVTEPSLTTVTHAIALTQAALRAAHLKYHLATIKVLTPHQIRRYAELRGYRGAKHPAQPHHGHQR